jgi:hypothetical protein
MNTLGAETYNAGAYKYIHLYMYIMFYYTYTGAWGSVVVKVLLY